MAPGLDSVRHSRSHISTVLEAIVNISRELMSYRSPEQMDGLTPTQLEILFLTAHSTTPVTPGWLAGVLRLTGGAITQAVDGLSARGLIEKTVPTADARTRMLTLTPSARRLVDEYESSTIDRITPWFASLEPTELATLAAMIGKVGDPGTAPPAAR